MDRRRIISILAKGPVTFAVIFFAACAPKTDMLLTQLEEMTEDFPAEVGISLIKDDGKKVSINGDKPFPLLSVVKFPQALAVCETMRCYGIPLARKIKVRPEELKADTWSPMREEFPEGGTFAVGRILEYSLAESDNNACDILFDRFGSPEKVCRSIKDMGIDGWSIKHTEEEMHSDMALCQENCATPDAAATLMRIFYNDRNRDIYESFIWSTMANCQTGKARIPRYIGDSCPLIIHKTGTGGMSPDGKVTAVNDLACIVLPDGRHCELAVFIKDASCGPAQCEELIAQIAKTAVEFCTNAEKAE